MESRNLFNAALGNKRGLTAQPPETLYLGPKMALLCPEDRQENPLITLLIGMPTAAMVEQPLSVWLAALEESLHTNTVILDNLTIEMESTEIKEAYRWITNQTKARSTQIKQ